MVIPITVTKNTKSNKNKDSDADSEKSSIKTFRIVKDGQQEVGKLFRDGKRALCGKRW